MYTLLVLALALALLYGWLVDHWFARVLMFLLLMVCLSFGGAALLHSSPGAPPAAGAIGGIVGAVLAWPVSGIPIYYQRYQLTGRIAGHEGGREPPASTHNSERTVQVAATRVTPAAAAEPPLPRSPARMA